MTYLIIGGLGFIGYNLAKELLKDNNKVIVIDNLSNDSRYPLDYNLTRKIKKLKENEEIVIDLIHPTGFCSIFKTKDEYELSLAIKGQKAITYKSKNPKDIIMKVIALLKDQATTGRKELKNARS